MVDDFWRERNLGFNLNSISGVDLIWDKIQESRQNQTISFLISIAGVTFFIGGFLETITSAGNPTWLFFVPYKLQPPTQNFVSLFMVISGLMFSVIGVSSCIYYRFDKDYYFQMLKNDDARRNRHFSDRKIRAFGKQLIKAQNELGECKDYIMNNYYQNEVDSIHYCKLLGKHWHELVEEDNLLKNINA